jgi:hypothetical protein
MKKKFYDFVAALQRVVDEMSCLHERGMQATMLDRSFAKTNQCLSD